MLMNFTFCVEQCDMGEQDCNEQILDRVKDILIY